MRNKAMLTLSNFIIFQLAWLSSVIGGARDMPWLGPVVVLGALAIHLGFARRRFEEILLVILCAILGASFDSALVASGWVSYKSGLISENLAPYWIVTMWMLFATTLNVSMRWMRGKPALAAAFGAAGGPVAYLSGQALGAIVLENQPAALAALAVGWAAMMPILMWLSEHFDGMSGQRRKWIAESTEQ
jgi:hypothetical protein